MSGVCMIKLEYEERDGDFVLLASQNDLTDLFLNEETTESMRDTINAIVFESISLPNLSNNKSINKNGNSSNYNSIFSTGGLISPKYHSPRGNGTGNNSNNSTINNGMNNSLIRPTIGNRIERFPSINPESVNRIRWKKGEMLGQGAFGVVYLGLNIETGELMVNSILDR